MIDTYLATKTLEMLRRHQWSATAYGNFGSTARMCPECGGIHPLDCLNNGGGKYITGKGHKDGCELAGLLNAEFEE